MKHKLKKRDGFSYIEILIALAIFAVALITVLPILSQTGRNLAFAEETYIANLHARHLMLTVRDALATQTPGTPNPPSANSTPIFPAHPTPQTLARAEAAALAFAADRENFPFTLWLIRGTEILHTVHSPNNTSEPPESPGQTFNFAALPRRTVIVTVIYNEHGYIIARAVGVY